MTVIKKYKKAAQ